MKEVKRWLLLKRPIDQDDIIWLRGLNCNTTIEAIKEPLKLMYGGRQHTFSNLRSNQVQVLTTTPKQETMLKLKYGDDIVLGTVVYLEHGEVYQDNLGTILG